MTWTLNVGSRQLEFGCELSGLGLMSTPQVKPMVEFDSYANPRGDGRRSGRMYRRGQAVSLAIEARPDERSADEVWREFLSVWRADEIRSQPGAMARLTADTGRFAVGLPVDIEPNQEYRIFDTNRASVVFEAQDDLWYGPEELTRVRFVPPSPVQSFAWVGEVDASASVKRVNGEVVARNDFTNPRFVDVSAIPAGGFQSSAWSVSGGFSLWVPPETPDVPYPSESVFPSEFLYPGE